MQVLGAGLTAGVEWTNADNVCDLLGSGYQHGADGKVGLDIEIGTFGGKGYQGYYFGLGLGISNVPIGYGFWATETETLY